MHFKNQTDSNSNLFQNKKFFNSKRISCDLISKQIKCKKNGPTLDADVCPL